MGEPAGKPAETGETGSHGGGRSGIVAAGILVSRLAGFARQRAVAYFFGTGAYADVLSCALRAPNLLQNLLGEGTLSASFIPIYARMLEEGREEEAGRFAGAIFGLLVAVAGGLALLGVVFAKPLVAVLAAGFVSDRGPVNRFPLAVKAVRITFPMTGVLVLHAWALGVLNSHRKFFLPYVAPVLWNISIISALVFAGRSYLGGGSGPAAGALSVATLDHLLFAACVGALLGGMLQFGVQVPLVWRVLRGFRLSLSTRVTGVRRAIAAFWPVVSGRGVVQLGAWLDVFLASYLVEGAVGALNYAQTLYILPISLFAMSVAAAELPELSRTLPLAHGGAVGAEASAAARTAAAAPPASAGRHGPRVERSLRQIALLVVPTVVGYLAFGYLVVGAIFRTGSFDAHSNLLVYGILAAYTLGLPASAGSRLFQNVFFALSDTRTPAKIAAQRVLLAATVAVPAMLLLDRLGVPAGLSGLLAAGAGGDVPGTARAVAEGLRFGAVGLALGSAVGAWYELIRLVRAARRRLSDLPLPLRPLARLGATALAAAAVAAVAWWALPPLYPALLALCVLGTYAGLYLGAAWWLGFPELDAWLGRLARRFRRR